MRPLLTLFAVLSLFPTRISASEAPAQVKQDDEYYRHRVHHAKLDLWLHGAHTMPPTATTGNDGDDIAAIAADLEMQAAKAPLRHGPVREVRRRLKRDLQLLDGWESMMDSVWNMRGGDGNIKEDDHATRLEVKLAELGAKFGKPFVDAIEQVCMLYTVCLIYTIISMHSSGIPYILLFTLEFVGHFGEE